MRVESSFFNQVQLFRRKVGWFITNELECSLNRLFRVRVLAQADSSMLTRRTMTLRMYPCILYFCCRYHSWLNGGVHLWKVYQRLVLYSSFSLAVVSARMCLGLFWLWLTRVLSSPHLKSDCQKMYSSPECHCVHPSHAPQWTVVESVSSWEMSSLWNCASSAVSQSSMLRSSAAQGVWCSKPPGSVGRLCFVLLEETLCVVWSSWGDGTGLNCGGAEPSMTWFLRVFS